MIYDTSQQELADKIDSGLSRSGWKDWRWQLRHAIRSLDKFEHLTGIRFGEEERASLERTFRKFPLSITPYYLSLIDRQNYQNDPVFKQAFGSVQELNRLDFELEDPLSEEQDSPVQGITHRYPDRVLFHVSNICSMYCRHCTRKRKVGDVDYVPGKGQLMEGIRYIARSPQVRDVLLSGGDPLMLSDAKLEWLLSEITAIPHVEIIRIGTRMPVVLPYRITDELVEMLGRYHPIWINTHFNHPRELTTSSREALCLPMSTIARGS